MENQEEILDGKVTIFKKRYRAPHPMAGKLNAVFQAKYKLKRGVKAKFLSTGRTDKAGAIQVATDKAFELEGRVARGESLSDTSFETIGRWYLNRILVECKRDHRMEKYAYHKRVIEDVLNPTFGNRPINYITASEIIAHINKRKSWKVKHSYFYRGELETFYSRTRTVQATTINKENVILRWVFKEAIARGLLDNIPDISNEKNSLSVRPYIEEDKLIMFMAYLDKWHLELTDPKQVIPRFYREAMRDWSKVIIYSGLRTSEACLLKWKDWTPDIEDGYALAKIIVRAEEIKGRKTGYREAKGLPQLNTVLANRRAIIDDYNTDDDYIFCHPKTSHKRWSGNNIKSFKNSFNKALVRCKLFDEQEIDKITPYVYRHTFATLSLNKAGTNIYLLAQVMGNSVPVIEKFYAKQGPNIFKPSLGSVIDGIEEI